MSSQNGGKKRLKGRSNSFDERKPRVVPEEKKLAQKLWRLNALNQRNLEGRFTPKNDKELDRLNAS